MVFNANSTTLGRCYNACPSGTYEGICLDPLDATNIDCCLDCHAACATKSCTGSDIT